MRGESARPGKRPLRALSASEKIDAITRVHDGESKASVARDIGVPESTLRGWCKSEHKIRGMARNSSTPDSEAHSPASSSGNNHMSGMGTSNLSSEDESAGPSTSKKAKFDSHTAHDDLADGKQDYSHPQLDYVSLLSGLVGPNAGASSQYLLNLMSSQGTANMAKNFLNLTSSNLAAAHLASVSQTVGLVENGLQYTKSSGGNSSRRSSSHISTAIAPSQFESVSKSRKSLPPAAEAPSTPVPVSPRKTNDLTNGALNLQQHNRNSKRDNGCSSSGSAHQSQEDKLMAWLSTQQQQLLGQQAAQTVARSAGQFTGNPSDPGSWFWQWYKQCSYPLMASTLAASSTTASLPHQNQATPSSSAAQSIRKSPTKIKAALDNVLCINNNNNENVRRSLNLCADNSDAMDDDDPADRPTTVEAIEHGLKFYRWLNSCSDPAVSRLQILQFKFLLDNIRYCRSRTSIKRRRK